MQRKPGFPVANCSIKMPDNLPMPEPSVCEDDSEQQQRRQQLINFGHSQWGFNNWNWAVTKQDLDFVDIANGKYSAGVVAFVSVSVKNLDIHRENIGYATSVANTKGFAIYKSRKVAVTNALRETLLSFGGTVASELMELLETNREPAEPLQENNQNLANINTNTSLSNTKIATTNLSNTKIATTNLLNTSIGTTNLPNTNIGTTNLPNTNIGTTNLPNTNIGTTNLPNTNIATTNLSNTNIATTKLANTNISSINHVSTANLAPTNHVKLENAPMIKNLRKDSESVPINIPPQIPPMKNAAPVAKAHPMPANLTIPRAPAPTIPRPNSNVSFVLQPVMGGVVPPMYAHAPPRLAPPQMPPVYSNYYDYGPWHFYEPHGNVNLNFNIPPKNLVVNSRAGSIECKNACRGAEGETLQYAPQQNRGCWIKPTIFYDGFWTEQKVKKWVAEQVEKQFPDEHKTPSPGKPDIKLQ